VWMAITDLQEMEKWYFDNIDSFRAEVGSKSRFEVKSGDRIFTHLWEVTEVVPFKKMVVNWKYAEYPGDSLVIFELQEHFGTTTFKLTMKVLQSFPGHIPEFKRESCLAGWQYFIRERLKKFLEKK
jgi:uncharacterized protein YndB with AHSA1/START domain